MNKQDVAALGLSELVDLYSRNAATHGQATSDGEHEKANAAFAVLSGVVRELRRRGLESQRALLKLLESPVSSVRCWAASHCLEFSPKESEAVLLTLSKNSSIDGFNAKMTLQEWKGGRLKFP
jgi:hypothetical protein